MYLATVKGAPETLKTMYADVPKNYDEIYLDLSRRGARVLALGWKQIGKLSNQELRELTREDVEKNLVFAGFVIISCPLKSDSKSVIKELLYASHRAVMITGDNPLTACHVAKQLQFCKKSTVLIQTETGAKWSWRSIDELESYPIDVPLNKLLNYELCVTGDGLSYLNTHHRKLLLQILPYVTVFARFAPKQKEFVVVTLKALGYTTLMCGDGTNDVGALKHADVGVAILSSAPERLPEKKEKLEKVERLEKEVREVKKRGESGLPRNRRAHAENSVAQAQNNLHRIMREMEEQDQAQVVKLGDASIASPFTSKLASIMCSKWTISA